MVLIRALCVLALAASCSQSLFDSHGSTDAGNGTVPSSCPDPCLADAAGDFDGTPTGTTGHWRYLDDTRNRAWTAMAGDITEVVGAGSNKITTCAKHGGAAACDALPGALLFTSTGATSTADPAIEVTTIQNQNVQLTLRVHVPNGEPEQIVRLYRNSREDVLFTATAMPGVTVEQVVTVDALAGDRFLLAVAPMAMGAAEVGVHLFVNPTGAVFPAKCQSAYSFNSAATSTTIADQCGANTLTFMDFTTTPPALVVLRDSAFPELGTAADIVPDKYFESKSVLDKAGDTTTQMWVKIDVMPPSSNGAWVWSDQDLDLGGGLGVVIYDPAAPKLGLSSCTNPNNPLEFVESTSPYNMELAWHFLRIVHTGGVVSVCVDGALKGMMSVPTGKLTSSYTPRLGRNVIWTPSGAFVDGHLDDVRVFNTALPCN
ncbi:hypothetical protein BH11MYX3_BH11MYX3_47070 [soil metagenome]